MRRAILLLSVLILAAVGVRLATAASSPPIYTVGPIVQGLTANPGAWIGRTLWIRGCLLTGAPSFTPYTAWNALYYGHTRCGDAAPAWASLMNSAAQYAYLYPPGVRLNWPQLPRAPHLLLYTRLPATPAPPFLARLPLIGPLLTTWMRPWPNPLASSPHTLRTYLVQLGAPHPPTSLPVNGAVIGVTP